MLRLSTLRATCHPEAQAFAPKDLNAKIEHTLSVEILRAAKHATLRMTWRYGMGGKEMA
jgi:hypothetical protein